MGFGICSEQTWALTKRCCNLFQSLILWNNYFLFNGTIQLCSLYGNFEVELKLQAVRAELVLCLKETQDRIFCPEREGRRDLSLVEIRGLLLLALAHGAGHTNNSKRNIFPLMISILVPSKEKVKGQTSKFRYLKSF